MKRKAVSLIALIVLLISSQPSVFAAKFSLGDAVEVCNTGGLGLRIRDSPAGNITGKKYDGDRGVILDGPQTAALDGIVYTWWRIRWNATTEGWSAEGYPGGVDYLVKVVVVGEPTVTVSLAIDPSKSEYYVGETIAASFTITNRANVPFVFDVLTAGGRDPDNQVVDFTFRTGIFLNPGESYPYEGILTLPAKTGNYHFFCAYRRLDGSWNTAIPTEGGATNVLDITVSQPAPWLSIHIRTDGSVDPPGAPIQRVGDVYTLTGDIYGMIVAERDNIVVDGAGYTVRGTGGGNGIGLSYRSNVTVKNTAVTGFWIGIYLYSSGSCTITGNTANNNTYRGINLEYSGNCIVSGNTANNSTYQGIWLWYSGGCTVSGNTANNNNERGIGIEYSSNCVVSGNNANNNTYQGIWLHYSGGSTVSGNTANNNGYGIVLWNSENNLISNNTCSSNYDRGISLSYSDHNTISYNTCENNYYHGIHLDYSLNNTISNNICEKNGLHGINLGSSSSNNMVSGNIANNNNRFGIRLYYSGNCMVSGNTANNNLEDGIRLAYSGNCMVSGNTANNNGGRGIQLSNSGNCMVSDNNANYNNLHGIRLAYSNDNTVSGNTANNNGGRGIVLYYSDGNVVSGNTANYNNLNGINLAYSGGNTLSGNVMSGNRYNFRMAGVESSHFYNAIDLSNLADGRPVYYVRGASGAVYGSSTNAATIYLIDSTDVTVRDLTLANNWAGVFLWNTTNSRIENVTATNNQHGIHLEYSGGNTITANTAGNNLYGIHLNSSSGNTIYHNNFIDNTYQVENFESNNAWDDGYPSGGNYWSDYTGVDANGDGIGDTPYVIDADNQDRYPLVTWTPTPPPKFRVGDWVRTTANLNVREGPGLSYAIIDTMPLGTLGQIVGGPVEADGYVWWNVDYAVGVRGWSAENWLELSSAPPPPTVPTQPVNLEPPDGATDVSLEPQFLCSPPLQDIDEELIPWEEMDGRKFTRVYYHVQITTTSGDYSKPVYNFTDYWLIDQLFDFPPSPKSPYVRSGVFDYGTTYYWRIRYKDFRGVWSPWSEETSFTTSLHIGFDYSPIKPIVGEEITFIARAGPDIVSYEWDFDDGSPTLKADKEKVNHSYSEPGLYTVNLTVTNDKGLTASTIRTIRVSSDWSFAVITDLHIGYCIEDYGTEGWEDSDGEYYWLTERLFHPDDDKLGIIEWINENEWTYNIHFVVVLGDITDTAEYSEFLMARGLLDKLNVPYIPIIGNHDVWPYIQESDPDGDGEERPCWRDVRSTEDGTIKDWSKPYAVGDKFFEEVFWGPENNENIQKIKALFGDSWERQVEQEEYTGLLYMQNYAFNYKGIKFIALDFVDREPKNKPQSGGAKLYEETADWLRENLKESKNLRMPTILLSHHPMIYSEIPLFGEDIGFDYGDAVWIRAIIEAWGDPNLVLKNFAGHTHRSVEDKCDKIKIGVVQTEAVCRESCALSPVSRKGQNIRIVSISGEKIESYDSLRDIDPKRTWDKNQDFLEAKCYWYAMVRSPVDLIVTDPEGFTLTKEVGEVAGMFYLEFDMDGDGELEDMILSGQLKMGDYQITVLPEPGASPTDTFTLFVRGLDAITILAENVSISDIPTEPYIVSSTVLTMNIPPTTLLHIGEPKFVVNDTTYLTSATPIELIAEDNPYGSGLSSTAYRIYNDALDIDWIIYMQPFYLTGLSDGNYHIDYYSTDYVGNIEPTNMVTVILDDTPPTTTLTIGEPKYATDITYVTSETTFTLEADDNAGSGIYFIAYRISNGTYDGSWLPYTAPFCLTALTDGVYTIEFNSTDKVGNVEPSNTATVILDNTGPSVAIVNPPGGCALQDGVTFMASAIDGGSGVSSVNFSIREANGGEGTPVGFEDLPAAYNATTGNWTLFFNTLQPPDGYYVVLVKAEDNLGNTGSTTVPYSIRNWAVIELLPASETNKAGRTMPVKFALRVAASVDPEQPFVYNEDLTIKIYKASNILQTSTFGDTARDYRINAASELYITNFQTLKTPTTYVVQIYREPMLIGAFKFSTVM